MLTHPCHPIGQAAEAVANQCWATLALIIATCISSIKAMSDFISAISVKAKGYKNYYPLHSYESQMTILSYIHAYIHSQLSIARYSIHFQVYKSMVNLSVRIQLMSIPYRKIFTSILSAVNAIPGADNSSQ